MRIRKLLGDRFRPEVSLTLFSLTVLAFGIFYNYLYAFQVPFPGLGFQSTADGWVVTTIGSCSARPEWCEPSQALRTGDTILMIGDLEHETFRMYRAMVPFQGYEPGDLVPLLVERGGEMLSVTWTMPSVLFSDRLTRQGGLLLFLPFWLAGSSVLLFLRPRDERWWLLIAFNFLVAIWLALGPISSWQIAYSSVLLHTVTWTLLPVSLHLHLALPTYLVPRRRALFLLLYLPAGLLIVLDFLRVIPGSAFLLGFLLAALGSISLLLYRLRFSRTVSERPAVRLMLVGLAGATGPAVIMVAVPVLLGSIPSPLVLYLVLVVIPLLPTFYIYALYKRRLGSLEFRANRLLGLYAFGAFLLTLFIVLFAVGSRLLSDDTVSSKFLFSLLSTLLLLTLTLSLRVRFQRWVNRIAYGARHNQEEVVQIVAQRIPSMTDRAALSNFLADEIMPSLLIRQSALYLLDRNGDGIPFYARGIQGEVHTLSPQNMAWLRTHAGEYRPDPLPGDGEAPWVHLVIPVTLGGQELGLWLHGRRDPDDFYPQRDVRLLQTLANQTAPVLENIRLLETVQRKLSEQAALLATGRALSSSLEWETILNRLAAVMGEIMDVTSVYIGDWDREAETTTVLAEYFAPNSAPAERMAALGDVYHLPEASSNARPAFEQGGVIIHHFDDEGLGEQTWERMNGHGCRTELLMPLRFKDSFLGMVILWESRRKREFTAEEIGLCQAIAQQVALAFENVLLFRSEAQRRQEAELLAELTSSLSSTLELDAVLRQVVDAVRGFVPGIQNCAISILEEDGASLHSRMSWRSLPHHHLPLDRERKRVEDTYASRQVLESGRPVIIEDLRSYVEPAVRQAAKLDGRELRSILYVPLVVRGRTIGILHLNAFETPRRFRPEEVRFCVNVASHAAIAIENARLYQETRGRVSELAILQQVALATSKMVELDELIRQTTEMIVSRLNYPCFGLLLVEEVSGRLLPHPSFYGLPEQAYETSYPIAETVVGEVVTSGQPRLVMASAGVKGDTLLLPGVRSQVCVPVYVQQQVIGVLAVLSGADDAFSESDVRFLTTLAGQMAAAIERAQLYSVLQHDAAKLAEQVSTQTTQLRTERDRTQAILHNAGEAIFFVSPTGIILYVNPAAKQLTGYDVQEVMGLELLRWLGQKLSAETRQGLTDGIARGTGWNGELVGEHKTGRTYDARVTISPIQGTGQEVSGFVGVMSDITRLREVDRLRAEFIANVSHELRTPLTNIKTYLVLLRRGRAESWEHYLEILDVESERLSHLIEDLLDFSDKHAVKPRLQMVSLDTLVEQTVAAFAASAEKKQIELALQMGDRSLCVWADNYQLGQVLANLVSNALSYTPRGGRIQICVEQRELAEGRFAALQVSDNGYGIAAHDLPFVFERFYRGRAAQQGNIPGTGLGLAISQEIVQHHGGTIEVASEEGQGAIFTVLLPLLEEQTQA